MPEVAILCPHYVRKIAPARWRKRPSKPLRDRGETTSVTIWFAVRSPAGSHHAFSF